MLSPKHIAFCNEYMTGKPAYQAYQAIYTGVGYTSALTNSARLLNNPEIQAYIAKLQKPIEKATNAATFGTFEEKRAVLWDIINNEASSNSDRIRALDVLSKLDKEYSSQNTVNVLNQLETVSTDDIKAILGK